MERAVTGLCIVSGITVFAACLLMLFGLWRFMISVVVNL